MKFLKEPQIQRNKDGDWMLYLENDLGDIYYLKEYQTWKNVGIAQEPGGHYAIIKADSRTGSEFIYKKVQRTKQYLFAFYKQEMNPVIYIHIYNENGDKETFKWENETIEENDFIFIPKSDTRYFIDSKKQKAYSWYHPKYWVERLH